MNCSESTKNAYPTALKRTGIRAPIISSIGLVTALVPVIGYEQSTAIAREALKTGGNVYDLVLEKGLLTRAQLDEILRPECMPDPRAISSRIASC